MTIDNWWKVKIIPDYGPITLGYVHKSRIQPHYIDSENCGCPAEYGMMQSKPVLIANLGERKIVVCGYLLQRQNDSSIKISEFTISDCQTNEVLRFYGAITTCRINSTENRLEVIELAKMPLGNEFKWIQTKI